MLITEPGDLVTSSFQGDASTFVLLDITLYLISDHKMEGTRCLSSHTYARSWAQCLVFMHTVFYAIVCVYNVVVCVFLIRYQVLTHAVEHTVGHAGTRLGTYAHSWARCHQERRHCRRCTCIGAPSSAGRCRSSGARCTSSRTPTRCCWRCVCTPARHTVRSDRFMIIGVRG